MAVPIQPRLSDAPSPADLASIADPIELARQITAIARLCGTLSPALSEMRRSAIVTARRTLKRDAVAAALGTHPTNISKLTKPTASAATAQ
jgi:hypothetical protein